MVPDFTAAEVFVILGRIGGLIFWFALSIFIVMLIVGAGLLVVGGGDPTRVSQGKKTLLWAGVGLLLVLVATGVVPVVRNLFGV